MDEKQITDLEDLVTALYIQTSRLYDVLATMLSLQYPEAAAKLLASHKEGGIETPPPALRVADEDNTEA